MVIELISFDCDGVLVDSEEIYNRLFHQMLAENGLVIPYKDSFATFTGLSLQSCIKFAEKEFGTVLPPDFSSQYEAKIMDLFRATLKPQRGIMVALEKLQQQMGYSPSNCAVIEDSIPGVQAGIAAGMTVFAYTGSFTKEALVRAGAHFVFDDMELLPELLEAK